MAARTESAPEADPDAGTPDPSSTQLAPRWRDFLDEVARRYPLKTRAAAWLCLAWPDAPDETIQVSCTPARGRMRVVLTADMCRADRVSEHDALELATRLLIGGVVIQRGVLALRCVLTDGHFSMLDLDQTITALRQTAPLFRTHLLDRKAAALAVLYGDLAE